MMVKIFMKYIIGFVSISVFSMMIVSCGDYINGFSKIVSPKKDKGQITYLTKELIDNKKADPKSYLVAFRTQPKNILSYLYGYKSEISAFYKEVYYNIIPEGGVKRINFLTSFDTTDNIEGLYYIDRKNKSVLEHLKNIDYIKNLKADKFNVFTNVFNQDNLSQANIVALAEVRFEDYIVARDIIDNWNEKGLIEYAEPNYYNTMSEETSWKIIRDSYENEFSGGSSRPYWHDTINLKDAFSTLANQSKTITHPIIAVFDSGVDVEHPKLTNHIWHNPNVGIANCGEDSYGCNTTANVVGTLGDGHVYPVGASGYNSPADEGINGSHGTHVAGIIAADAGVGGDSAGYGGVCPVCKIMAVKEVNSEGTINDMAIVRGFKYISYFQNEADPNQMVRIVNASLGKTERSRSVGIMISKLKDTPKGKGVLVVAAAGNENTNVYTYMAAFPDTLSVSNIDQNNRKHDTSNYGKWVNIAAPGSRINSTVAARSFDFKDGTSMATPVVAGVAGLVVSIYPDISQDELKKVLLVSSNSSKLYDANPGYKMSIPGESEQYLLLGIGVVDASLAVQKATSQGNLYYTSQDRFTGLCGSLNVIKKDSLIKSKKDNLKTGMNGLILFMIPIVGTFFVYLRKKDMYRMY